MAEGTVQIEGLARLVRTLRQANLELDDLKQANYAAAQTVAQWAAVRAPRRTGRLGGSVGPRKTAGAARVASSLVYAGPIHYGWPRRHIRAQPFVVRAAAETQSAWVADYEKDLRRICANVRGV